jgi:uncharacterized protein YqjF (DUF2071 family)
MLRPSVPFELDLYQDWAYVSLVALRLDRLRLQTGGRMVDWNDGGGEKRAALALRTYVKQSHHPHATGTYFLAAWLDELPGGGALSGQAFGFSSQTGRLDCRFTPQSGIVEGCASNGKPGAALQFAASLPAPISGESYRPSIAGSLDEFLLERYALLTRQGDTQRLMRLWHEPLNQAAVNVHLRDEGLLADTGCWLAHAERAGAHLIPGTPNVWIGRPLCINGPACARPWPGWER